MEASVPKPPEKVWSELFTDPASGLSGLREAEGGQASLTLRLALWFEHFLQKGADEVREKLSLLPEEELLELAVLWLQCYLSQPLYLRIHRGEGTTPVKGPLNFSFLGRLIQVEQGSGNHRRREILYPLEHKRLWPEALALLPKRVFSSPVVIRALAPALSLAADSRLEKIRKRRDILSTLLGVNKETEVPRPASSEVSSAERKGEDPLPAPAVGVKEGPSPGEAHGGDLQGKKKKKRKSAAEQLELFS